MLQLLTNIIMFFFPYILCMDHNCCYHFDVAVLFGICKLPLHIWFIVWFSFAGDFVVVNPIKEGNKVLAEITYVLYSKQIKYLQQEGFW